MSAVFAPLGGSSDATSRSSWRGSGQGAYGDSSSAVHTGVTDAWAQATKTTQVAIGVPESAFPPGWRVSRPIPARIEVDETGFYLVADDVFDMWGEGETISEAVRDYAASLTALYELTEQRAETHASEAAQLALLRRYIQKRNA